MIHIDISNLDESTLWPCGACILVGADMFDAKSPSRIAETRKLVGTSRESHVFAVTSSMPGAYREFTKMSGADDCIIEAAILPSLKGVVL